MIDEQEVILVISYGNDIDNLPGTLPEEKVNRLSRCWLVIIVVDSLFQLKMVMSFYRDIAGRILTLNLYGNVHTEKFMLTLL